MLVINYLQSIIEERQIHLLIGHFNVNQMELRQINYERIFCQWHFRGY